MKLQSRIKLLLAIVMPSAYLMSNAEAACTNISGPWVLTAITSSYIAPPSAISPFYACTADDCSSTVSFYAFTSNTPFTAEPNASSAICPNVNSLTSGGSASCTVYENKAAINPNYGGSTVSIYFRLNVLPNCRLSGQFGPTPNNQANDNFIVRGGVISGNYGSGVGTKSNGEVIHFTLIKN